MTHTPLRLSSMLGCYGYLLLAVFLVAASAMPAHAQAPPTITSLYDTVLPQANPNLATPPPHVLNVFGTNFTNGMFALLSVNGGGTDPGTVQYISPTSILVSVPQGLLSGGTSISIQLCSSSSGCVTSNPVPIFAPALTTATLTAAPSPGFALSPVILNANFAIGNTAGNPSYNPAPGAPSGSVNFTASGTSVGNANLILDPATATFTPPATTPDAFPNIFGASIVSGDINGDGLPDLILGTELRAVNGSASAQYLDILIATTPYGKYVPVSTPFPDTTCTGGIFQLGLGDFNGDGIADLIYECGVFNQSTSTASDLLGLALGNGDGTFQPPSYTVSLTTPGGPFAIGDFDQNGYLDLVVGSPLSASVTGFTFYSGNGAGGFAAGIQSPITSSVLTSAPQPPAVADMNADGYPDLVLYNEATSTIEVYQNNKNGHFGAASATTAGSYGPTATVGTAGSSTSTENAAALLVGDFNGDGLPDVAAANFSLSSTTGEVVSALNTSTAGTLSFGATSNTAAPGLLMAATGDFNGDGRSDLAIANGTNIYVLDATKTGSFAADYPGLSVAAPIQPGSGGSLAMLAQDVNADGYADLIANVSSSFSGGVSLTGYVTSGSANATLPVTLPVGAAPLTATWIGNNNFTAANANSSVQINGLPTTTAVQATPTATEFGQPVTFTIAIAPPASGGFLRPRLGRSGGIQPDTPPPPTPPAVGGTVTLYDNGVSLGVLPVTAGAASVSIKTLTAGPHTITAIYSGDSTYASSSLITPIALTVAQAQPALAWTPTLTTIPYGTALTAAELNAIASTTYFTTVPGTYTYSPTSGTVPAAGLQTLSVRFTPTDTLDFKTATKAISIQVTQLTPTIVWPTPAAVSAGSTLSATQLNATARGANGAALTGTFLYTPPAGTVLTAGTRTLSVLFTPSDTVDYTTASSTQTLQVVGGSLTSILPQTANLGDPAKLVTFTGTGFGQFSTVLLNGTALPTTFVNATTLTATIPASALTTVATLSLAVSDQALGIVSNTLPFTVVAPTVTATFSGPSTSQPGQQPSLSFNLPAPYPVPLTGTLTLTFTPAAGSPDDPAIQFSTGGRNVSFTLPANTTTTNAFQLQSGTVTGTITVSLTLTGGGANVTPPTIQPISIQLQPTPPIVSSVQLTRAQKTLTVVVHGFSNTRQITQAAFHFTAAPGASISTTDVIVPVQNIFATWFTNPTSDQYGSIFTYTQSFTLDADASTIGSVSVTLSNSVGQSTSGSAQ